MRIHEIIYPGGIVYGCSLVADGVEEPSAMLIAQGAFLIVFATVLWTDTLRDRLDRLWPDGN